MDINDRIRDFRDSVTPDLYRPSDFIDWESLDSLLDRLRPGVIAIQTNEPPGGHTTESLGRALYKEPNTLEVLMLLTAIRSDVRFEDGRQIPARALPNPKIEECQNIASVFLDIGINQTLLGAHELEKQVMVAIIASQADRRRFPTRNRLEYRVQNLVLQALSDANKQGVNCKLVHKSDFPPAAKRKADHVISISDGNPVVVSTVFQTQSGGRQQRDLRTTFPKLRSDLEKDGLVFCLIADGQGIKEASDKALTELLKGVPHCMTMRQGENGALTDVIMQNRYKENSRQSASPALETIIESILAEGGSAKVEDLPSSSTKARLALASYAKKNSELGLVLTGGGKQLAWRRPDDVRLAIKLSEEFGRESALELWSNLIGADIEAVDSVLPRAVVTPTKDSNLPSRFLAFASQDSFANSLVAKIAQTSFEMCPEATLAILLVRQMLSPTNLSELRRQQLILPVNVIVVDVGKLETMAKGLEDPAVSFAKVVLEQSDLEKVSPFVVRGVTPAGMFYGRGEEEATLLSSLGASSVAILGGRRIGKTSLIKHTTSRLLEAGFLPFFCDCQAVRNWEDFGGLISKLWGVDVPRSFRPHHLYNLVEKLAEGKTGKLVILLDEIDQLLDWDMKHTDDEVPESFFRACRAISQENLSQFVFSGERVIARKIWDPHSPHWNFCKPLLLRQLDRTATESLIQEPLLRLGIEIGDKESLGEEVWIRTSGHPELVQFIGDALIRRLNTEVRTRLALDFEDVIAVTDRFEYAEQYIETYWGQATDLEKLVSIFLSQKSSDLKQIMADLERHDIQPNHNTILESLRMLELYGLVKQTDGEFQISAEWFGLALGYYGGATELARRQIQETR